jgi:hypothetical protein
LAVNGVLSGICLPSDVPNAVIDAAWGPTRCEVAFAIGRLAASFAERIVAASGRLSGADGNALQVGQRKVRPAVAAIGVAEKAKQRGVLAGRQEFPLAELPV